jgi:plastocyanin
VLTAAATLTTGALTAAEGEAGAIIAMTDSFAFAPDAVTIHAGEAVEWKNASHFRHTVTADPKLGGAVLPAGAVPFNSAELAPGATFRHVLTVPGTYRFFCMPHEGVGMVGTITVVSR